MKSNKTEPSLTPSKEAQEGVVIKTTKESNKGSDVQECNHIKILFLSFSASLSIFFSLLFPLVVIFSSYSHSLDSQSKTTPWSPSLICSPRYYLNHFSSLSTSYLQACTIVATWKLQHAP